MSRDKQELLDIIFSKDPDSHKDEIIDIIKLLNKISLNASVRKYKDDTFQKTLLCLSIEKNSLETVKAILEHKGCEINKITNNRSKAFYAFKILLNNTFNDKILDMLILFIGHRNKDGAVDFNFLEDAKYTRTNTNLDVLERIQTMIINEKESLKKSPNSIKDSKILELCKLIHENPTIPDVKKEITPLYELTENLVETEINYDDKVEDIALIDDKVLPTNEQKSPCIDAVNNQHTTAPMIEFENNQLTVVEILTSMNKTINKVAEERLARVKRFREEDSTQIEIVKAPKLEALSQEVCKFKIGP